VAVLHICNWGGSRGGTGCTRGGTKTLYIYRLHSENYVPKHGVGTAGTTGALDPAMLKLQEQKYLFAPFLCFTNLLNMKFVIGAYKRILR